MTASVKIRTSWVDNNVILEGVRIYKKNQSFDVNALPPPLVEITAGSEFYEDFSVAYGQTYFYMLSCFLGDQEVFTECFEVEAIASTAGFWVVTLASTGTAGSGYSSYNPQNTSNPYWEQNFGNTINFGAFSYEHRQTPTTSFTKALTEEIVNKNPLNREFTLNGFVGYTNTCNNNTEIYFEDSSGTTLAILKFFSNSSVRQTVQYGLSPSDLTTVGYTGSSAQLSGKLKVLPTGLEFVRDASATQYINSFNFNVDLSTLARLRVKHGATVGSYSGGAVAYFLMICL